MNEELFKLVIDNIPNPMWIKDRELRFIYANKEYKKIFDGKIKNFIGLKHEDLFDERFIEKYNNECRRVIDKEEVIVEEGYTMDGIYRRCTIFPLVDVNGEVKAIAGIDTNIDIINERDRVIEEQEGLLEAIVDTLPGKIFYKDVDSRYVYVNKEYEKLHENNGVKNIIGKTDFDTYLNEDEASNCIKSDKEVIEKKKAKFLSFINEDSSGNKTYTDVIKKPVIDKNGDAIGIVGFAMDVTEKKQTEEKLRYLSYTDSLTGVNNRTCFDERVEEYLIEEYHPIGVIMGDVNGLKMINDTLGHLEGDKLLKIIANILRGCCEEKGDVFRIGGDEFVILIPNSNENECEVLIKRILHICESYNNKVFDISISLGKSIKKFVYQDIYETLKEADNKVYRQKLLKEKSARSSIINSLSKGLGTKSIETKYHTERLLENAVIIGERLNLSISEMDELLLAAKLHDIGKIGVSEAILTKPGKLTSEEFEIIKTHTEKGYRIIKGSNELESVANAVLYHHERWDGEGYPMGISGEDIPLLARIICIVDAYDVMTNDRVYKNAMSKEDSIKELERCSGTQFDPEIVKVFSKYLKEN